MKVFEKPGKQNTDETIRLAIEWATQNQSALVAPTTEGDAGCRVCELAQQMNFKQPIVIVSHAYGTRTPGVNLLKEEHRKAILAAGATIVTAAHALSGVERGMSSKFQGVYPAELMAHTLRMFSQGVKVTVEIACMAMDNGAVPYGPPLVSLGGTGKGLDTAVVLTPAYSASIFDTKIHEILCMPY